MTIGRGSAPTIAGEPAPEPRTQPVTVAARTAAPPAMQRIERFIWINIAPTGYFAPHATLRGLPERRKSHERDDAGLEKGIRVGRLHGRPHGAVERKRGVQRIQFIGSGDRAQGGSRDSEKTRSLISHHRASRRYSSRNPRLGSLQASPPRARRETHRDVSAREVDVEAR